MVDSELLIYPRPERLGGGGVARADTGFAMGRTRAISTVSSIAPADQGRRLLPMFV